MSGYIHCAGATCFEVIIGTVGDLCDDCAQGGEHAEA